MIKKLTSNNFDEIIEQACRIIKAGGIVIAPFDTVYGFICDPYNDLAIEKIYELKGRDLSKPIGVALNPAGIMVDLIIPKHVDFANSKTIGPYTLIFPLKDQKISKYCQKDGTIAVRVPNSELILTISKQLKTPLAQTSANKSGQPTCATIEEIEKQFSPEELESADLIIDGGKITNSEPSKIFDLTGNQPAEINR